MKNKLNHIAFIMDGNNRWSKKNNYNKYNGYKKGANTLINLSNFIFDNTNAKYISAFALSKNNLNRSQNLISTLKKILSEFLNKVIEDEKKYKFNIKFIGDRKFLSKQINIKINELEQLNKAHKKYLLIYINYSGKADIEQASLKYTNKHLKFDSLLMTKGIPDPDILIRTGGYNRLSDFLLYKLTFTELYFLKKLWPELNKNDLSKVIINYNSIERKFGL